MANKTPAEGPLSGESQAAKKLLVAEDSVTMQKAIAMTFAAEDFVLTFAPSGDEALAQAKKTKPDAVIVDATLSGKDGYEVCSAIKAEADLAHVPVLLLHGQNVSYDVERGKAADVDAEMIKPFVSEELITAIQKMAAAAPALAAKSSMGPVESLAPPIDAAPAGDDVVIDTSALGGKVPAKPVAQPALPKPSVPDPGAVKAPGPPSLSELAGKKPAPPAAPGASKPAVPSPPKPGGLASAAKPAPEKKAASKPPVPSPPKPPVPSPPKPSVPSPPKPASPGGAASKPTAAKPPTPSTPSTPSIPKQPSPPQAPTLAELAGENAGAPPVAASPVGKAQPAAAKPLGSPAVAKPPVAPAAPPVSPPPATPEPATLAQDVEITIEAEPPPPESREALPSFDAVAAPPPVPAQRNDKTMLGLGSAEAPLPPPPAGMPLPPLAVPPVAEKSAGSASEEALNKAPGAPSMPPAGAPSTVERTKDEPVGGAAEKASEKTDAAAYEAIAKLSREIIEKVVWEVVPELAEKIIREELDRLVEKRR